MPYKVVFRNGENAKNGEEVVINATRARVDDKSNVMEFIDDNNITVAYIPIDRVLYIKKVENS